MMESDHLTATGDRCSSDQAPQITHRDLGWEELVVLAQQRPGDTRFAELSDDEVERSLSMGAAQIAAATCQWLELLAEFVIRGTWADQGARTPGVWLSWKLGIGPSTAREHVRVALRLRDFPRIRERFAAGTLSYSKVRCLTRFGDPAFEPLLLMWADDATASQLESIAGGFRRAERARIDDGLDDEDDPRWTLRGRSHADGTRTLTVRGPAELVAAMESEVDRLARAMVDDRYGDEGQSPAAGSDDRSPGPDSDSERVHEGGQRAGDPALAPSRDPQGEADDLRDEVPARPASRVTTADRVEALSLAVASAAAAETPPDTSGLDRHTLVLSAHIDDLATAPNAAAAPNVPAGTDTGCNRADIVAVADDHRRVHAMDRRTLRRLACDAGIVVVATDEQGQPAGVGKRKRRATAALRRALQSRDRACTFPGCAATRHLHAHHVQHWADGGATDLGNLVLVCGFHHRFVHQHGWLIEVRPDGYHHYRDAVGDRVIERIGTPMAASAEAVGERAPRSASAEALAPPTHAGGPFDLDIAVAVLQQEYEAAHGKLGVAV